MATVVIDYGAGNLRSVAKALEAASILAGLTPDVVVSSDPEIVRNAERILLPGDGAFPDCKRGLLAVEGLWDAIAYAVLERKIPFLGICIGMQLLATSGNEFEETTGFDWIPGRVEPIVPADPALKVPHMGWNTLHVCQPHTLIDGVDLGQNGLHAYFLHSYHLKADKAEDVIATADYGGSVTALVARDNIAGMQFHPEKSQRLGLMILSNFLRWKP